MKTRKGASLVRKIKTKATGFKRPASKIVAGLRAPRPKARKARY